ncbi:hypothetical protein Q672_10535 [Marinobacter sp. EVN1]|uniref:hypothetical protein n=1 Tax=Marinobacter sp. EVN1 TaxID=1397532 RepID=UPI0003B8A0E6|nr:hypothetical protein [Marinobacter sp. EVN1]ERS88441.1 hypothetical protein Q672_10535 [Marinobacter sp. EVN1]
MFSIVADVVRAAAALPWWGALVLGFISYLVIAVGFGGFVESQIAAQEGSRFHSIFEIRLGRIAQVAEWVGLSCIVVGVFFAVRNHFFGNTAGRTERGVVGFLARLFGRNLD